MPWMTDPSCLSSIEEAMDGAGPEEREILRDYYTWLQRMIRNPDLLTPRPADPPPF